MNNPSINKPQSTLNENFLESQKQNQHNSKGFIVGLILGVVLTSIGVKFLTQSQSETTSVATPSIEQKQKSTQAITVTKVTSTQINSNLQTTGTLAAFELIPIMTKANNLQITSILADEGDLVKEGQVLAKLDDTLLKAELAQAQASVVKAEARLAELKAGARPEELARTQESVTFAEAELLQSQSDLDLAQKKLERNRKLAAEGAIATDRLDELVNEERLKRSAVSKSQARLREAQQQLLELQKGTREEVITQAQASLNEAKARVMLVKTRLKHTRILAPVSGKIATRNARVGDVVSSSSAENLFTIIENGRLELQVSIPETQLNQIAVGQSVKITADGNSNLNLKGKVREIVPTIDRESRQATVNVDLAIEGNLKPGMFLKADIIVSRRNALTVPMSAVLPKNEGEAIVYVVQPDNTVKSQPVLMGELLPDEEVEIKAGLNQGDIIAVKGAAYLKNGDVVTY